MKKLLSLLGALGLTATGSAAVVACGDDSAETNTPSGTQITLGDTSNVTAAVGATVDVEVTNADELGTITVASSDDNTATATYADGKITVTGVAAGKATITVSSDVENVEDATFEVEITEAGQTVETPTITLGDTSNVTAKVGATVDVEVTNADELGTIIVTSSDVNTATATYDNGKITVTGVAAGKATITVSSDVENVEEATFKVEITA